VFSDFFELFCVNL